MLGLKPQEQERQVQEQRGIVLIAWTQDMSLRHGVLPPQVREKI